MGPANVDLSVSNEQRQLVDSFAALYARESTSQRVRAAEPSGFDARLWKTLQENGVVHMAVDEAAGGWGASELELALIAEPFGRAVASAPVIEAQVAARLLARCGPSGAESLARTLAGDALMTMALLAGTPSDRAVASDMTALTPPMPTVPKATTGSRC